MKRVFPLVLLAACGPNVEPDPDGPLYADLLGEPIPGLNAERSEQFDRGHDVMLRAFRTDQGLGPTFNADSCQGCHQLPVVGGSAPRYRDFFLVRAEREDGTLIDVGTNGTSPVRNLYATDFQGHLAEPEDTVVFARRNAPPFLGVGLFEFVPDDEILKREDPADRDRDGISGRANYEQGRVGRFGVKSQAASVESFNRGAMLNQMGITSNPLFAEFPEQPQVAALEPSMLERVLGVPAAYAQVSAPGEPTTDDDGAPDPEMTDDDQLDLLVFTLFLAPPKPAERTDDTRAGAKLFDRIGCTACHVPSIESTVGPLQAYTDLLVHDLGEANSDGLQVALASPGEFRTQPLWGVAMHGPFLHDGSAETLVDAIEAHGGEAERVRKAYRDLSDADQALVIGFLESLGPFVNDHQGRIHPQAHLPAEGEDGGPEEGLSDADVALFREGELLFDRSRALDEGLGRPVFNADSCRACHQDPAVGGAGGIDVSVLRFGHIDGDGVYHEIDGNKILFRGVIPGERPQRLPDLANVVETRQPPSIMGLGRLDALPEAVILANADPNDLDSDGISGVARMVDGVVGRFGWKAQVPTLFDFAADAALVENGLTADLSLSPFTDIDDDATPDPEIPEGQLETIVFYLQTLGPPVPRPGDPAMVAQGQTLFDDIGCAACHLPDLGGEAAYTDLLLHDVAPPDQPLTDQEPGVLPTEFRTPPLWGVTATPPYLHHGLAPTLHDAITTGHFGEAEASRLDYEALTPEEQQALLAFVHSL